VEKPPSVRQPRPGRGRGPTDSGAQGANRGCPLVQNRELLRKVHLGDFPSLFGGAEVGVVALEAHD